jgi:hypothetical protein
MSKSQRKDGLTRGLQLRGPLLTALTVALSCSWAGDLHAGVTGGVTYDCDSPQFEDIRGTSYNAPTAMSDNGTKGRCGRGEVMIKDIDSSSGIEVGRCWSLAACKSGLVCRKLSGTRHVMNCATPKISYSSIFTLSNITLNTVNLYSTSWSSYQNLTLSPTITQPIYTQPIYQLYP